MIAADVMTRNVLSVAPDATIDDAARILERHRFRLGVSGSDVRQGALPCLGLHHIKHFLGDVGGPHPRDMGCKGVGDVAATGRDIEDAPVFLRCGESNQALEAFAERVRRRRQIMSGGFSELLLDQSLVHGMTRCVGVNMRLNSRSRVPEIAGFAADSFSKTRGKTGRPGDQDLLF